ncbi:MAG: NADH-quinone oxidoreductase subunit A [Acidimicrobiales bacterium]
MADYLPLLVLLVLALAFTLGGAMVSKLLATTLPTAAKYAPYECGIVPRKAPPERFPVRFYLVAMIFVIFDIEIVFLYPYATIAPQLGGFGFWAILIFSLSAFESLNYVIAKGALDWGPVQRIRVAGAERDGMISAERTTRTTIRRVGLDGRQPEPAEAA